MVEIDIVTRKVQVGKNGDTVDVPLKVERTDDGTKIFIRRTDIKYKLSEIELAVYGEALFDEAKTQGGRVSFRDVLKCLKRASDSYDDAPLPEGRSRTVGIVVNEHSVGYVINETPNNKAGGAFSV